MTRCIKWHCRGLSRTRAGPQSRSRQYEVDRRTCEAIDLRYHSCVGAVERGTVQCVSCPEAMMHRSTQLCVCELCAMYEDCVALGVKTIHVIACRRAEFSSFFFRASAALRSPALAHTAKGDRAHRGAHSPSATTLAARTRSQPTWPCTRAT
jgi:hypothetical protein